MNPTWRSAPGILALLAVASLLALLFLPRGDLSTDASSFGVGRDGYRLGYELLDELGYDVHRYTHGVENLPDGMTLWALEPGPALLDEGPAGMGGLTDWIHRGNTLLLAFGKGEASFAEILLHRIDERQQERAVDDPEGTPPGDPEDQEETSERLSPTGTPLEAMLALGIQGVQLSGERAALDVGFDDPRAVEARFTDVAQLRGVRHIPVFEGDGLATGETLLSTEDGPVIWKTSLGDGEVILISDARLLCNWALAGADNGYLAVSLAQLTAGDRPILMEEFSHGYASVSSLVALLLSPPALFVSIQVGLMLAVLVLWRTRRFGAVMPVAQRERRDRAEHVEALADLHRRASHGQGAAQRMRAHLLARLRDRMGHGARLSDEDLFRWLATRMPYSSSELFQMTAVPASTDTRNLLTYARRLERLRREIEEAR